MAEQACRECGNLGSNACTSCAIAPSPIFWKPKEKAAPVVKGKREFTIEEAYEELKAAFFILVNENKELKRLPIMTEQEIFDHNIKCKTVSYCEECTEKDKEIERLQMGGVCTGPATTVWGKKMIVKLAEVLKDHEGVNREGQRVHAKLVKAEKRIGDLDKALLASAKAGSAGVDVVVELQTKLIKTESQFRSVMSQAHEKDRRIKRFVKRIKELEEKYQGKVWMEGSEEIVRLRSELTVSAAKLKATKAVVEAGKAVIAHWEVGGIENDTSGSCVLMNLEDALSALNKESK